MIVKKPTRAKWMCTLCGRTMETSIALGMPIPGRCMKNKKGQEWGPHKWKLVKKF